MKRLVATLALAAFLLAGFLYADDWTTVEGNTYRNVKVVSHDDGFVTIMDDDGGARLMLTELPPALRVQFGFDPMKANACVVATLAAEAQSKAAIDEQRRQQDSAVSLKSGAPTDLPTVAAAPAAVVPAVTPVVPTAALATPSTAPKASSVDVVQNEAKIADDQQALQDSEIDLRDARREVAEAYRGPFQPEGTHVSGDGTYHPDYVGNAPRDRIAQIRDRQEKLETEIKTLQTQDDAAAKAGVAETTGTGR